MPQIILTEESAVILTTPARIQGADGRGSLARQRDNAVQQRIVTWLSREHLRRLLLNREAFASHEFNANGSVVIRNTSRFWPEFTGCGDSCPCKSRPTRLVRRALRLH
jgi:hypothetical protein